MLEQELGNDNSEYDWQTKALDISIIMLQISSIVMSYGISQSIRQAYTAEVNLREQMQKEQEREQWRGTNRI